MNLSDLLTSFAAAFNQDQRLISLQLGDATWSEQLLPQSVTGREGINQAYCYQIECLSPDGAIELKTLLGLPVVLGIQHSEGGQIERCGVVSQAQLLGSDGGFAKYSLKIEPPFSLLRYRRTSRVFQDISVPDILQQVLGEHQANNSLFSAVQTLDFKLSGEHLARSYCLQYRESDYDFLVRLLHEEGLSWRFVHLAGDSPQVQLVVFDDAFAIPEAHDSQVRFHRADATEETDALTIWNTQRQVGSSRVSLASFDYKAANSSHTMDESAVDQGDGGAQIQSSFEDYDPQSLYYASDAEQLSRYAQLRQQAHDGQKKSFSGSGTLRSLQAGQWFRLEDHPAHEWDSAEQREFAITELNFRAHNNLPHDLTQQLRQVAPSLLVGAGLPANAAMDNGAAANNNTPAPYQATFTAQRRGQPITPSFSLNEADSLAKPKSRGVQTATVVGPAGEEIHTDESGRIKVQFHWQRQSEHADYGANLDDKSSCWIRVAYPSAGANWGHQFIPRIGQEVLVDFIEGDIDRPIVTGVVYNGSHPSPTFSGAGSLPANKTLSGIKSKEYKGGQYGELLFDDSTGQVRTKLSSEHGKTQLNLGYLIHPRTDGKGAARGDGFELRSDLSGTIRSARGLLLTAHKQTKAKGGQLDRDELIGQLEVALAIAQQLAKASDTHEAETTDTELQQQQLDDLKHWEAGSNTDLEGQDGGKGILAMSAPVGLALSSQGNISVIAASNHDQVAGQDFNQSIGQKLRIRVGQSLSIFVQQLGMKLIAAAGKIKIQAQSDEIEVGAAKRLHLYSLDEIILEGPKITLRAQGAEIVMGGGNIITQASAKHTQKAAQHSMEGAGNGSPQLPNMPKSTLKTNEQFSIVGRSGKAIEQVGHEVRNSKGAVVSSGNTDEKGATSMINGNTIEPLKLVLKKK